MTKRRYLIVLMMFLSISVNYMDRVNFSVSIPAIRHHFDFSLHQIGEIAFVWGMVYAFFNFPGGWIIDRLGLRWSLFAALGWWSVFTILTPFAGTLTGWYVIRGLMGVGEAPIWPINAKCTSTWAAPGERSRLYTWAGSGQYVGPAIGMIIAGWILVHFGWQWTFITFGIAGLVILPFWVFVVRDRPSLDRRANAAEVAWIGNRADMKEKADWAGIKNVFCSRTGIGMLLIYLTFGYILFTFLYWVPSYMYYTFHMGILKSAAWASLGALFGFIGFILSGPFNDGLVAKFDRLTARRIGTVVPMAGTAICIIISIFTARAGMGQLTAILIGIAQFGLTLTVGAWAVNIIDISPNQASTGFVYGIFNGVLNVMGALNSLILTGIAARFGFPIAFGSALVFMAIFMISILFIVDQSSYRRLVAHADQSRKVA